MTHDEVFAVVRRNIHMVLPDISEDDIQPHQRLSDLGADSLDRMDVVLSSQADLHVEVPPSELAKVRNIGGLVTALHGVLP